MNPQIIQVAIALLPELIDWFKAAYASRHPDAPGLTDDEVKAGLATAVAVSLARGDEWLAAHKPEDDAA